MYIVHIYDIYIPTFVLQMLQTEIFKLKSEEKKLTTKTLTKTSVKYMLFLVSYFLWPKSRQHLFSFPLFFLVNHVENCFYFPAFNKFHFIIYVLQSVMLSL